MRSTRCVNALLSLLLPRCIVCYLPQWAAACEKRDRAGYYQDDAVELAGDGELPRRTGVSVALIDGDDEHAAQWRVSGSGKDLVCSGFASEASLPRPPTYLSLHPSREAAQLFAPTSPALPLLSLLFPRPRVSEVM